VVASFSRRMAFLNSVDDIYGPSTINPEPSSKGVVVAKKRLVTRFTHCDAISAHGPISSMTFSLAKNGVSSLALSVKYES